MTDPTKKMRQHEPDFEKCFGNLMNHLNAVAFLGNCTCLVHAIDTLEVFFVGLGEDMRYECCFVNAEVLKDASDLLQQWHWALAPLLDLEMRDFIGNHFINYM